jgi:hypothetical protein
MLYPTELRALKREMVRAAGVEPTTYGFGDRHSIQLSYARDNCRIAQIQQFA